MRPISQLMNSETITVLEKLGKKIKNKRKLGQMTLEQLALYTRISRSTIALIEKGAPGVSIGSYIQIMTTLDLKTDLELMVAENLQEYLRLRKLLRNIK